MRSSFNGSQSNFILLILTGISSFFEYLADFTLFSPKYTAAWGNQIRDDIAVLEMMPIDDARRAETEALRIQLAEKNRQACSEWQRLKRYITKAFDGSLVNIKLMAAGQNLYSSALNENWPNAQMMYSAAIRFMNTNLPALLANDNMPPAFPAAFGTTVNEYKQLLANFEDSKETALLETQNRLMMLNGIYDRFIPMMLDGQEIFRGNEAVRRMFIATDVLSRISGPGLAGIRGKIIEGATQKPIQGAVIGLVDFPNTAVTDEVGNYLLNAPSKKYSVTITAAGFITSTIENVSIEIGTVSKLDVAMTAQPPAEPEIEP